MYQSQKHLQEWIKGSGVSREIATLNLESIDDKKAIAKALDYKGYHHDAGWLVRSLNLDGTRSAYGQFKPDTPFIDKRKGETKGRKYLSPSGTGNGKGNPLLLATGNPNYWQEVRDSGHYIVITEGAKKAAAGLTMGLPTIGALGVTMCHEPQSKEQEIMADHGIPFDVAIDAKNSPVFRPNIQAFATFGRKVIVAFDADFRTNPNVKTAISNLCKMLDHHGCRPFVAVWDADHGKGLDDLLVSQGREQAIDTILDAMPYEKWRKEYLGKLKQPSEMARDIAAKYSETLCYLGKTDDWYQFIENYWQKLKPEFIDGLVAKYLDSFGKEYKSAYVSDVAKLLKIKLYRKDWSSTITVGGDRLQVANLLPFKNVAMDLTTNRCYAHSPELCLTWQLPYDHSNSSDCPLIQDWLLSACSGHGDQVQLLRSALKAIVTGRSDFERFIELLGRGGTGKSTFARLAVALVGRQNTLSTSLQSLESSPYETSAIEHRRLIVINDSERWNKPVPVLKAITGNDFIRTEEKFKQRDSGGTIVNAFVLITANESSTASSDYTSGLARRKITIPFTHKVDDKDRRNLISIAKDGTISGEFLPELPMLLNWVLSMSDDDMRNYLLLTDIYCPSLTKHKLSQLCSDNPIAGWIMANCIFDPSAETKIGLAKEVSSNAVNIAGGTTSKKYFENSDRWLYANYAEHCRDSGIQRLSLNRFGSLVADVGAQMGYDLSKIRDSRGSIIKGLRLRTDEDSMRTCEDSVIPETRPDDKLEDYEDSFEVNKNIFLTLEDENPETLIGCTVEVVSPVDGTYANILTVGSQWTTTSKPDATLSPDGGTMRIIQLNDGRTAPLRCLKLVKDNSEQINTKKSSQSSRSSQERLSDITKSSSKSSQSIIQGEIIKNSGIAFGTGGMSLGTGKP